MNGDKVFLDTNIIIYLYSEDELSKKNSAEKILDNYTCIINTQVLNEASNIWFKKFGWNGIKIKNH